MTIIILSNVSTLPITSIAKQLELLVFEEEVVSKTSQKTQQETLPLSQYQGVFQSKSSGMSLEVSLQADELYAQLKGRPAFKITSIEGHTFLGKKIDIEMIFEVKNGKVTGLTAERMSKKFRFKKR